METSEQEYKFTTSRIPKGLVGGYAPGEYVALCCKCNKRYWGLDKRATSCFACGVDTLISSYEQQQEELKQLREFKSKIVAAHQAIWSASKDE